MRCISTRGKNSARSFHEAILNCMPDDGGLYVPENEENLKPWILYMDETTSFQSIASTLAAALLKEELSPVISERLAYTAFPFSPRLVPLTENLSLLELYHGWSGSHKDFGISFLASYLEHVLVIENKTAVILAATTGEIAASISLALRGKKKLKAVLIYPGDKAIGIPSDCLMQNGGNILPIATGGALDDCYALIRRIYGDKEAVKRFGLTLANTINIGRLLPQTFFYMYAFTRLKKKVRDDILYAQSTGNYGNLTAGLYAWKFSLPVNGFITDSTPSLTRNSAGYCVCPDSITPLNKRSANDPATPSNLERLEQVFEANSAMMRALVFPENIDRGDIDGAIREFYRRYNIFIDSDAARAYLAAKKRLERKGGDNSHIVLIQKDHPAAEAETIRRICADSPEIPEAVAARNKPVPFCEMIKPNKESAIKILEEFCER